MTTLYHLLPLKQVALQVLQMDGKGIPCGLYELPSAEAEEKVISEHICPRAMVKGRGLDWLPVLVALLLPLPFHFQVQSASHSWNHSRAASTPVFGLRAENEALSTLSCRHGASN